MQTQGKQDVEIDKSLAFAENMLTNEVEDADWRPVTLATVQQLLVSGNACEQIFDDNTIKLHRLDRYVVRRDYFGRVLEAVIEEPYERDQLPVDVPGVGAVASDNDEEDEVCMFTWIVRRRTAGGPYVYKISRWVEDRELTGETEEVAEADLNWLFLRWNWIPGEDYGRSKIEEMVADLRSLEGLSLSQMEHAAMAARNFVMVRPGATGAGLHNRIIHVANGGVVVGDPEAVEMKSFENVSGYQITSAQVDALTERLARAFLLHSAGQRDAERVTATEIERDIQEIESALGGSFSTMNSSMMGPRTRICVRNMVARGAMPKAVAAATRTKILTGLEALSRERDVGRAQQAAGIVNSFGPEAAPYVKFGEIMNKAFIGIGFPNAVRSEEEAAQLRQEMQAEQAAGQIANTVAGNVTKGG